MPAETVETLARKLERLRTAVALCFAEDVHPDSQVAMERFEALRAALDETKPEPASGEGMGDGVPSVPSMFAPVSEREETARRVAAGVGFDGLPLPITDDLAANPAKWGLASIEQITLILGAERAAVAAQQDTRADRDGGQAPAPISAHKERAEVVAEIVADLREMARRAKGRAVPPPDWRTCNYLADYIEAKRWGGEQ